MRISPCLFVTLSAAAVLIAMNAGAALPNALAWLPAGDIALVTLGAIGLGEMLRRGYLTLMGSKRHFAPPIDRQSFMEVDGVVAGRRYCTREGTAFFGAGWNEPVWLEISKEELEALEDNHALLLENGCDQPRLRSKVVPLQQTRRNAGEAVPLKRIPSSTKLLPRWKP